MSTTAISHATQSSSQTRLTESYFFKGFSWGFPGQRGEFSAPEAEDSLRQLRATGCEWISLCFGSRMDTLQSSEIAFGNREQSMVTDEEIRWAIETAHRLGFQVMMKPMVELRTGEWRSGISHRDQSGREAWWRSFEDFLLHYGRLAAETNCALYCLGCEMGSTEGEIDRWRQVISRVRTIYGGSLTYNCNHDRVDKVSWWDAVDLISISAYYSVGKAGASVQDMREAWHSVRERIAAISSRFRKQVFFAEIGVMSSRGNSASPAAVEVSEYDGDEQAAFYEAAFQEFWNRPWFAGYFWWKWDALLQLPETAHKNSSKARVVGQCGFRINGKPAHSVVREWYAAPRQICGF